ncbi:hypothetical protein [uncultured Kocuria sp.]|uniref:hypothetical protein n=1 Tax=uncultured Kocuria sp. TaxID=259305 RepID=UPI00262D974E|nr:hypothetical protein [uncultured Kocuria sp.]
MQSHTPSEVELRALVTSIGEQTLLYLGKDNLTAARVTLDPKIEAATVEVALEESTPANRQRAFTKFIEVIDLFDDEVDLMLRIADHESLQSDMAESRKLAHCAL